MALAIFIFTYAFLAGARFPFLKLDRPGGALLGAVLMVLFGGVSSSEVFNHSEDARRHAVDLDTLMLLLAMMMLASYLAEAAFFRTVGFHAVRLARTPRMLLVLICVVSAVLSAFLVNDTVCLMLTPLVLAVVEEAKLPPRPYLFGLCMASNSGSVATFTGNPQNMLIQGSSGLSYAHFAAYMTLPAVLSTGVVVGMLLYLFRHDLPTRTFEPHPPPPPLNKPLLVLTLGVLVCVVLAFFMGLSMSWSALTGAAVVMALSRRPAREALERVDYVLLVFFASLFVVVYGVNKAGWAEDIHQLFAPWMQGSALRETVGFASLTLVASNLFSNVPFVMLARSWVPSLNNPLLGWHLLALGSTLAGNLTLLGSVANLIVFEAAREKEHVSFLAYLRVGVPVTLVSFALGVGVLWLEHTR